MGVSVLKSWLKAIVRQTFYRDVWFILTNIIMLIVVANVALAVLFFAKDKISSFALNQEILFDQAGAPINSYQNDWLDYTACEGIIDQAYAGEVMIVFVFSRH